MITLKCNCCEGPVMTDENKVPISKYWKELRTRAEIKIVEVYCSAKCSLINYEKEETHI